MNVRVCVCVCVCVFRWQDQDQVRLVPKNANLIQHFTMNQKGKTILKSQSVVPGAGLGLGGESVDKEDLKEFLVEMKLYLS